MKNIEKYKEVIEFLYEQLPVYQRDGKAAFRIDLNNILKLDACLGEKHKNFKTIHVAGTNGKGSVSHMLSSILQSAGYKTGLYTSPHLKDFRERIRINGKMIPENELIEFVNNYNKIIEDIEPSFFELTVAVAFEYFDKEKVDIAIIETGLGGRLDSTNIISPKLSVITNIGYDHTQFLGNTLSEIAKEKAGIIKENTPVVIGESQSETEKVFMNTAKAKQAEIYFSDKELSIDYSLRTLENQQQFNVKKGENILYKELKIDLLGLYQKKNVITALQAIDVIKQILPVPEKAVFLGLQNIVKNTGLQGKWQILGNNPLVVCDTAHNKEGLQEVVSQIKLTPYKKLHMIIGFVNDKDISTLLELLPENAEYYITKASIPRSMDEDVILEKILNKSFKGKSFKTVKEAVHEAKKNANKDDMIFIGGSTFVVAEVV